MRKYWKQNKGILSFTLCMGIAASALSAGVSIILQQIIDAAISENFTEFQQILIFTVVYMLVLCAVSYLSSFFTKYLSQKVIKEYRKDIFQGIMRHSPRDYYKHNTADYISVLTNDMKLIEENYIVTLFATAEYVVMFLFTLLILLALSPVVTGILIVMMLIMFLVPALMGRMLEERQKEVSEQVSVFTEKIKDMFSGFETIRSYRMYPYILKKFHDENAKESSVRFRASRLFALNEGLSEMLSVFSTVVVIFVSAYLVLKGNITMGTLIALVQLSGTFITPVVLMMQNFPKIQSVKPVIEKLNAFAQYEPKEFTGSKTAELQAAVSLENVSFSYSEETRVLDSISMTLEAGKKYAVLGHSGCGKSTLAKILTGYTDTYNGNIYYDKTELRDLDINSLLKLVTVMHQNVYLFHDTIEHNIILHETYSQERFEQAVNDSGISQFYAMLPEGYQSSAGENGSLLSGGQKQRVALARALIRAPKLLVLDEGTSAVDMQTASEIERKLLAEKELTLLTITHDINKELLKKYDEIIYMENGKIIGKGNFETLQKTCDSFQKFYE